jgi:hypothetical protein
MVIEYGLKAAIFHFEASNGCLVEGGDNGAFFQELQWL